MYICVNATDVILRCQIKFAICITVANARSSMFAGALGSPLSESSKFGRGVVPSNATLLSAGFAAGPG